MWICFLTLFCLPFFSLTALNSISIHQSIERLIEELLGAEGSANPPIQSANHSILIGDTPLFYHSATGHLPIFDKKGTKLGELFFTAYLKDSETLERPITFIFDGGPGGSSMGLHIGALGPRRILFPSEGQKKKPPFQIVDNQETLLDLTDLVFIDPIGSGYSKATDEEREQLFYSIEGDIASFAEFIRVFLTHFERWNSPKYLLGCSYGTCRACGLTERLMASSGIYVDGIILLGCALDYNFVEWQRDLSFAECLSIPTFAATAWYHGRSKLGASFSETIEFARRFALEDYAPVMAQPTRLSPFEQKAFYQQLADLIGLPLETVQRYQGRIDEHIYTTEFFASKRQLIGGTDSRYIGPVSAIASEYREDPSYKEFFPSLFPAYIHYLATELETSHQAPPYKPFAYDGFMNWNWSSYDTFSPLPTRPNFMQRLRRSLVAYDEMKIFIGSGYYDIRTPFAATEYSIDHLELPDTYRRNFQFEYYEAGHGFFFHLPSLQKFKCDLTRFYRAEGEKR